jgi:hypothetical protein
VYVSRISYTGQGKISERGTWPSLAPRSAVGSGRPHPAPPSPESACSKLSVVSPRIRPTERTRWPSSPLATNPSSRPCWSPGHRGVSSGLRSTFPTQTPAVGPSLPEVCCGGCHVLSVWFDGMVLKRGPALRADATELLGRIGCLSILGACWNCSKSYV